MITDMPAGIDIEAMAREAGFSDEYGPGLWTREPMQRLVAAVTDHAASIAERMGLEADGDEAKRLAVEIGAAIRSEVA